MVPRYTEYKRSPRVAQALTILLLKYLDVTVSSTLKGSRMRKIRHATQIVETILISFAYHW